MLGTYVNLVVVQVCSSCAGNGKATCMSGPLPVRKGKASAGVGVAWCISSVRSEKVWSFDLPSVPLVLNQARPYS